MPHPAAVTFAILLFLLTAAGCASHPPAIATETTAAPILRDSTAEAPRKTILPVSFSALQRNEYLAAHIRHIDQQPSLVDLRRHIGKLETEVGCEAIAVLVEGSFRGHPEERTKPEENWRPDLLSASVATIVKTPTGVVVLHNFQTPIRSPALAEIRSQLPLPAIETLRINPPKSVVALADWKARLQKILHPTSASGILPMSISWDGYSVGLIYRFDREREEMRIGINCFHRGDEDDAIQSFNELAAEIILFALSD